MRHGGPVCHGEVAQRQLLFVLPKRADVWFSDERPCNGGLGPVLVMVARDKVHLLAPDISSEVSGIGGSHFEGVVAKDVQLVFGLDLFIDICNKRIVHCVDAAEGSVCEFEDTLVPKMAV